MSYNNISTENLALSVNGRLITDFGETDPAFTIEDIDESSTLRRGQGGSAIRLDRINNGRQAVLNLNPAGDDSAFMMGLRNAKENITITYEFVGTGEAGVLSEGLISGVGTYGRAGQSITDDQYTMMFNLADETRGGE